MAEPAHSPAPFQLRGGNPPPVGYVIYDAMGDSIGALAYATGDHPAEEQLANARLFTASPKLLIWAQEAERFIAGFEGDELQDDLGLLLKGLRSAIAEAEGREP
ncbi:hypothetical protein OVA11_14090 [Caulobacter sp. SL161]|uniref:hypothetical protein n=1 Tax=Caulobacter sp. SL161 TaxID=2995156 RepID=UPI0022739890|nr:hypothetical protein [Caulobacter sp. SL161]MCY1648150.1 hypothetical protein [Caulobacter sp. SL161]